jgi:hypothetical protein
MKRFNIPLALLTPVEGYISLALRNTWIHSGASPSLTDALFDTKYVSNSASEGKWRGCVAKRNIATGEKLLSVPWGAVISVESDPESSHEKLTTKLYERVFTNNDAVWKEYVKVLPKLHDLKGCLFWGIEDINELHLQSNDKDRLVQASMLLNEQRERIARSVGATSSLNHHRHPLLEQVSWCQQIVHSRSFVAGEDLEWRCLSPIADLFNHQPEAPWTQTLLEESGQLSNPWKLRYLNSNSDTPSSLELYCPYDTKSNTEIYIPYGVETNLELLSSYGFFLHGMMNEAQYVPLFKDIHDLVSHFSTIHSPEILEKKLTYLSSIDACEAPLAIRPGNIERSGHLIGCVMYLLSSSEEALTDAPIFDEQMNHDIGHFTVSPVSSSHLNPDAFVDSLKRRALEFISTRCRYILGQMPTCLEEDKRIQHRLLDGELKGKGGGNAKKLKLALEYRMDVKQLLLQWQNTDIKK